MVKNERNIAHNAMLGKTKAAMEGRATLEFVHELKPDDQTHCGLYGLEYGDELAQDLVAQVAQSVIEVTSAYSATQ